MNYDYDIPIRRTVTFPRWKCALAAMFGQREIETETCVLDGYHVRLFTEFYYLSGVRYVARYYVDKLGKANESSK